MKYKPCPFCGSEHAHIVITSNGEHKAYFVACNRCACRGPQSIVEENAYRGWNERSVDRHKPIDQK